MPSWDMGKPRIDADDGRAIQEALDAGREPDYLR
jgi:hypothetical protein